ncbi:hypothetical protein TYRP_023475 [Tyrophagus putrescentiae]|nr:hypothetical protein TYRP_023475 [Tyrophagus putrescentiae]
MVRITCRRVLLLLLEDIRRPLPPVLLFLPDWPPSRQAQDVLWRTPPVLSTGRRSPSGLLRSGRFRRPPRPVLLFLPDWPPSRQAQGRPVEDPSGPVHGAEVAQRPPQIGPLPPPTAARPPLPAGLATLSPGPGRPVEDPSGPVHGAEVAQRPPQTGPLPPPTAARPPLPAGLATLLPRPGRPSGDHLGPVVTGGPTPGPIRLMPYARPSSSSAYNPPPTTTTATRLQQHQPSASQVVNQLARELEEEEANCPILLFRPPAAAPKSPSSSPPLEFPVNQKWLDDVIAAREARRRRLLSPFDDCHDPSLPHPEGRWSDEFEVMPNVHNDTVWPDGPKAPFSDDHFRLAMAILKQQQRNVDHSEEIILGPLRKAYHVLYSAFLAVKGGDPSSHASILAKLHEEFKVEGKSKGVPLVGTKSLESKFSLLFSSSREKYLPHQLIEPMVEKKDKDKDEPESQKSQYMPSKHVQQLWLKLKMYKNITADYVNPEKPEGDKITGQKFRQMLLWAQEVLASIEPEEPTSGPVPWPGPPPSPAAAAFLQENLKSHPNLLRMTTDYSYYESQRKRASKLLTYSNQQSTDLNLMATIYLLAEAPHGLSLFDFFLVLLYVGITTVKNMLARDQTHRILAGKGEEARTNKELYGELAAILRGGTNLLKLKILPQFEYTSKSTTYLAELSVISVLKLFKPCFNVQAGNSSQVTCPIGSALPEATLQEIGFCLLLEAFHGHTTGIVVPWIASPSPAPLHRLPPLRLRQGSLKAEPVKKELDEGEEQFKFTDD